MPHCLIEAARQVSELIAPQELVQLVHDQAAEAGLFQPGEVKVRLSLYEHHCVGGEPGLFVHLIFYVLAGLALLGVGLTLLVPLSRSAVQGLARA